MSVDWIKHDNAESILLRELACNYEMGMKYLKESHDIFYATKI